jgi:signal transduction histidine kinase
MGREHTPPHADGPEQATPGDSGRDRLARGFALLYRRLGGRIYLAVLGTGTCLGLITIAVASTAVARFLGLSATQLFSVLAIWVPIALALTGIGLILSRGQIRTILAWSEAARTRARAPDTWRAIVEHPLITARCVAALCLGIPAAAAYVGLRFHKPWWAMIPIGLAGVVAVIALAALVVFATQLIMRPMLDDVTGYLPAEFEPPTRGARLRTKALAPLPAVTLIAAAMVGAYDNLAPNGYARATIALGVALVTTAVATIIFLIINRSLFSPIDTLIAATERVRAGDIETPVPVLSDDELGTLAHGFNQMLASLHQRTGELEASREDLRHQAEELRLSRERIVTAADHARRQLERDLHDGAQQRLVLLGLKLAMAQRLVEMDPNAKTLHEELRAELNHTLKELRDLAHGIYPAILESEGLPGALEEVAQRSPIPTELDCDGTGRHAAEVEAAVYFCCLEALQNTAKHAGPDARATVRLAEQPDGLSFDVIDNGPGFDTMAANRSSGIQNMTDRIGALGGELRIESTPGQGTRITGRIPLEDRSRRDTRVASRDKRGTRPR